MAILGDHVNYNDDLGGYTGPGQVIYGGEWVFPWTTPVCLAGGLAALIVGCNHRKVVTIIEGLWCCFAVMFFFWAYPFYVRFSMKKGRFPVKITAVAALAAFGLGTLGLGTPARADLQIDQKTVIDCPGLKQMFQEIPTDQRAPLLQMLSPMLTGTPWLTTTYLQNGRMRTDMGQTSVIVNAGSGGAVTLDRQSHRYSLGAYDPFQPAAGQVACRITPTGRTSTLLGHAVRGYLVNMTCSVLPNSTVSGEMWAAPDLPSPPTPHYTGTASAFAAEMARVKGMPLAYTLVYHNTPVGDITVVSSATAIKNTPLTADVFRIPADFQRGTVQTATALPSTGFPLGDGMPLDSLGAVTDAMATGESSNAGGNMLGITGLQGLLGGEAGQAGALTQGNLSSVLGPLLGGSGGQSLSSMMGQLSQELQAMMQDDE